MHDIDEKGSTTRRLFALASEQMGYFTTRQAGSCGISRPLIAYHSRSGRFVRVRRGVYRLRDYPPSPREEVFVAWIASGGHEAVVSHESALDLLNLSDVVPERIHLTVARASRYRRSSATITIHTTVRPVPRTEIVMRDGLPVTSPLRSILDAAATGTAPEQIIAAIAQALQRGLATKRQFEKAAGSRGRRVERLVRKALMERQHR